MKAWAIFPADVAAGPHADREIVLFLPLHARLAAGGEEPLMASRCRL